MMRHAIPVPHVLAPVVNMEAKQYTFEKSYAPGKRASESADIRKSRREQAQLFPPEIRKGYYDRATGRYDLPTPGKQNAPTLLPTSTTSPRMRLEVGATCHFEHEGTRFHCRIKAWGKLGATVVTDSGDEWAVTYQDLHQGVHSDQRLEYEARVRKSRERNARAMTALFDFSSTDPESRMRILKSMGLAV